MPVGSHRPPRLRTVDGDAAVRLVLGMRSSAQDRADDKLRDTAADQLLDVLYDALEAGPGEAATALRKLRTDGLGTVDDITAYVSALLLAEESGPYHGHDEEAARAAALSRGRSHRRSSTRASLRPS